MKKILIRHLGNMGDLVFLIPPVLHSLKKHYPDSHITLVTAWGYKEPIYRLKRTPGRLFPTITKNEFWGRRNQGGFSLHLMATNPHVDQLIHYHQTKLDLAGTTCHEDSQSYPTWNEPYYQQQKSGHYDAVFELDFGLDAKENPLKKIYEAINLPQETYSHYQLHFTKHDRLIAETTISQYPHPRIVLLESLEGTTTRGWDPAKIDPLSQAIKEKFGVAPIWFGGHHVPFHQGRPLTLRQNIARLFYCDVGIGVLSGPLHFAAAVGLPTLTLYGDQPIHRAAPAYFLNSYQPNSKKHHRTLLGPTNPTMKFLKEGTTRLNLTPLEWQSQEYQNWQQPGRQNTKSCLATISIDEVMTVLTDMVE